MAEQQQSEGVDPYRAGFERIQQIIVTTGNEVAGHDVVAYLGIVRGIVVRATSIGKGIIGGFKALGGGNIKEFIEVCELARHDAYQQMIAHAQEAGAEAIIGMRYDAGEFSSGVTEVLAYGTAVKIMPRIR
ncbi:MAG TPA: YbjQ family protein [Kofleriaceae bacterium]|nr:YbjQ family protein [Kofleriaceae bacterium]